MGKYKSIITEISVYGENDNPIFGVNVTKISLNDIGAGMFVELRQPHSQGFIALDNIDEIDKIFESIKLMISNSQEEE